MTALAVASLAAVAAGALLSSLRWLRVAQREHYLPGSAIRFALRWWRSTPLELVLVLVAVAGIVGCAFEPPVAVIPAAVAAFGPRRLGIRGRTSRLVWTRRLTRLVAVFGALELVVVAVGAIAGGLAGAVAATATLAIGNPVVLDLALAIAGPVEDVLAGKFVRQATSRLEQVRPIVVGVTGSYGKTTTKGYIAHLIGADRGTLASPQSYNNRAGLSRTVNEHLSPSTEVLVAEMGAYGPGEITALCGWLAPEIAVITAIGPAHLERFKSLDRTLMAKAEIAERARVTVLNTDDERLAGLANVLETAGKKVVRASGTRPAVDVAVLAVPDGIELRVFGRRLGTAIAGASDRPTALSNAACAVGVAIELGIAPEVLLPRLATLPVPPNRLQRYVAERGYVVLDDTFNANPKGARLALARLGTEAASGRRVVVTPGMVELGATQHEENASFSETASAIASHLVVVARTNRRALAEGAERVSDGPQVVFVDRLDEAVAWVRKQLGPGDAVLYENDLPDHFP